MPETNSSTSDDAQRAAQEAKEAALKSGSSRVSDMKKAAPKKEDTPKKTDDKEKADEPKKVDDTVKQIVEKINKAESILIALSNDPNVDELSAALGLALVFDKIGKHATAIYSGETPNAIGFLNPEKTFETNTNSLQDFIIALNKDKADHLRYKVEGNYVKVFITPYRTTIDEGDLEFSHGDYNVDLVLALNVASADALDGALSEHGRITHDASVINISTGEPGKFGEIEWTNPEASSISEMVTGLAEALGDKDEVIEQEIATALLTGIEAETNRFSNDKTSPETMGVASKLMAAGADQKTIAENVELPGTKESLDVEGEIEIDKSGSDDAGSSNSSDGELEIEKGETGSTDAPIDGGEASIGATENGAADSVAPSDEPNAMANPAMAASPEVAVSEPVDNSVLDNEPKVETAEDIIARAEAATNAPSVETVISGVGTADAGVVAPGETAPADASAAPTDTLAAPAGAPASDAPAVNPIIPGIGSGPEMPAPAMPAADVLAEPVTPILPGSEAAQAEAKLEQMVSAPAAPDYSSLMDAALAEPLPNMAAQAAPAVNDGPEVNHIPELDYTQSTEGQNETPPVLQSGELTPVGGATAPSGVMNFAPPLDNGLTPAPKPADSDVVLPPPPAPPIPADFSASEPLSSDAPTMAEMPSFSSTPVEASETVAPAAGPAPLTPNPVTPVEPTPQPITPEPEPVEPALPGSQPMSDPSAFHIPGM